MPLLRLEADVDQKSLQILKLNKEFRKENIKVRILYEQISSMKSGVKTICLLIPKENIENAFKYEHYLKTTKRSLSFINQEKIFNLKSAQLR